MNDSGSSAMSEMTWAILSTSAQKRGGGMPTSLRSPLMIALIGSSMKAWIASAILPMRPFAASRSCSTSAWTSATAATAFAETPSTKLVRAAAACSWRPSSCVLKRACSWVAQLRRPAGRSANSLLIRSRALSMSASAAAMTVLTSDEIWRSSSQTPSPNAFSAFVYSSVISSGRPVRESQPDTNQPPTPECRSSIQPLTIARWSWNWVERRSTPASHCAIAFAWSGSSAAVTPVCASAKMACACPEIAARCSSSEPTIRVWPVDTRPTVAARDALSASTAWSWSAAMSWRLRSIASCWRAATWAGPFSASVPNSAWPSRTVVNGGSWIGWALGWLMPDDSIRAFVASRSASSDRFSGGIASGRATLGADCRRRDGRRRGLDRRRLEDRRTRRRVVQRRVGPLDLLGVGFDVRVERLARLLGDLLRIAPGGRILVDRASLADRGPDPLAQGDDLRAGLLAAAERFGYGGLGPGRGLGNRFRDGFPGGILALLGGWQIGGAAGGLPCPPRRTRDTFLLGRRGFDRGGRHDQLDWRRRLLLERLLHRCGAFDGCFRRQRSLHGAFRGGFCGGLLLRGDLRRALRGKRRRLGRDGGFIKRRRSGRRCSCGRPGRRDLRACLRRVGDGLVRQHDLRQPLERLGDGAGQQLGEILAINAVCAIAEVRVGAQGEGWHPGRRSGTLGRWIHVHPECREVDAEDRLEHGARRVCDRLTRARLLGEAGARRGKPVDADEFGRGRLHAAGAERRQHGRRQRNRPLPLPDRLQTDARETDRGEIAGGHADRQTVAVHLDGRHGERRRWTPSRGGVPERAHARAGQPDGGLEAHRAGGCPARVELDGGRPLDERGLDGADELGVSAAAGARASGAASPTCPSGRPGPANATGQRTDLSSTWPTRTPGSRTTSAASAGRTTGRTMSPSRTTIVGAGAGGTTPAVLVALAGSSVAAAAPRPVIPRPAAPGPCDRSSRIASGPPTRAAPR